MKLTSRASENARGPRTDIAEAGAFSIIVRDDGSVMIDAAGSGRDWTLTFERHEWRKMIGAYLRQRGATE